MEMAELDSDDEILEQVYRYLTKSQYPDGVSESRKRAIQKKAKKFCREGWRALLHPRKNKAQS